MAGRAFRTVGISAALALAAMGCTRPASVPPADRASSDMATSYRATGNEPFWAVAITPGTIVLSRPDAADLTVATPVARPTFNGRRYETPVITIDVTRQRCQDGMSGATFSDRVMVVLPDALTLDGCGGDRLPPATIAATQWSVTEIDGQSVAGAPGSESLPTLDVAADGSVSGNGGCNRYRGGPTLAPDGGVRARTPIVSTRMACVDAVRSTNETHFLEVLERLDGWRFEGSLLILLGADGRRVTLRQAF